MIIYLSNVVWAEGYRFVVVFWYFCIIDYSCLGCVCIIVINYFECEVVYIISWVWGGIVVIIGNICNDYFNVVVYIDFNIVVIVFVIVVIVNVIIVIGIYFVVWCGVDVIFVCIGYFC